MYKKIIGLTVLSLITAAFVGCASVQKLKTEAVSSGDNGQNTAKSSVQQQMKYVVKKGDSLWKISAKSSIYGDPFEWPLLYKANRDQIIDPDIIDTNEELGVNTSYDKAAIESAKQDAKETPPYRQHSKPRKKLPLKY